MGLLTTPDPDAVLHDAVLSAADFERIKRMLHAHAGIVLHEGKRTLAESRLAKLARHHAGGSFAAYVDLVARDSTVRTGAIEALTTNHTNFYREKHHFAHVEQVLRPHLAACLEDRGSARCWSAGSSSGEEVYSLAMTILGGDRSKAKPFLTGDIALLATDINHAVLATGAAGAYAADALAEVPAALAQTWCEIEGDRVRMATEVRNLVRFRQLNLLHPWPMKGRFDAIFCRNTMIYFDAATTERLQMRLADQLAEGGYLYIGHSERLLGAAAKLLRPVGQTMFRKVAA